MQCWILSAYKLKICYWWKQLLYVWNIMTNWAWLNTKENYKRMCSTYMNSLNDVSQERSRARRRDKLRHNMRGVHKLMLQFKKGGFTWTRVHMDELPFLNYSTVFCSYRYISVSQFYDSYFNTITLNINVFYVSRGTG